MSRVQLEESWRSRLVAEFHKPYMNELRAFLQRERAQGKTVFPQPSEFFAALDQTPFDVVRVVVLGQDPYHGPGQAHGLSFSVRKGVPLPPSLRNIFQELKSDLGLPPPASGDLTPWARQGVLLLNATLSVESGRAGSHQNKGWETFTDQIIERLAREREGLAFVLWGSYAQKKGAMIDRQRHFVVESPHPSPLSAHRGFFGSKPFSRVNQYLRDQGEREIDWTLS
jgi:uracil-DNA glycosylase